MKMDGRGIGGEGRAGLHPSRAARQRQGSPLPGPRPPGRAARLGRRDSPMTILVTLSFRLRDESSLSRAGDARYTAARCHLSDSSRMTASSSALRGVDSVHLEILLMGTRRQCGSWSVAGHNHRKVIGRDPICAS